MQLPDLKRFSLRTMFVLTTLVCVVVGMWSVYVNPFRRQLQSLAAVDRLQGNSAKMAAAGPTWQKWLVTTFLGDDAYVYVTEVDLANQKVSDADLRSLTGLTHLEKLSLDYTQITDDGAVALRSMPALKNLSMRYTGISDRSAEYLAALPALTNVYLTGTKLTDAAIENLGKERAAKELYIRWTKISDEGATRLAAALPNCAVYHHALTTEPTK